MGKPSGQHHGPYIQRTSGHTSVRNRGTHRSAFDWHDFRAPDLWQFVNTLCGEGHGVVLSATSDGGALSVTILCGDERIRDWLHSADDVENFLSWFYDKFTDGPLRGDVSGNSNGHGVRP